MLIFKDLPASQVVEPRAVLTVELGRPGTLLVADGLGRQYFRGQVEVGEVTFRVAGALGSHSAVLLDAEGVFVDQAAFRVDTQTKLRDSGGRFEKVFEQAYFTMKRWGEGGRLAWIGGKFYRFYVIWLRDHVHTLKGMKWFDKDELKSAIDLYAEFQREDGMIYDRLAGEQEVRLGVTWRDVQFREGNFTRPMQEGRRRFERIPVENDVEYLFVEGLYQTWKATGDTDWMRNWLDQAIRAVRYGTSDPYRWSEKFGLLKRGYTIDTWDFQAADDAKRAGSTMQVSLEKTEFNVMHGDNTGMAMACGFLAEMLREAGRAEEAEEFARLGAELLERLNALSWNGEFYTHQVPENPEVKRDFGVDPATQVSLSNAYNTNRGIGTEKARAIVETYQRIRREMPETSPGEFYQIYPPYEKGFGGHNAKWQYMNGGVTTIVAGELAHGAFESGYETYGVDILDRVRGWGDAHEDYLHCCLRGAIPPRQEGNFTPLDLRAAANADFHNQGADGVPGWAGEAGENDLAPLPTGEQVMEGVPFRVIDPSTNGRRGCLGLSARAGYTRQAEIAVGRKATSLAILHARHNGKGPVSSALTGTLRIHYADGTSATDYVLDQVNIGPWFIPDHPRKARGQRRSLCRVGWHGANADFPSVGVYVWALNNPCPEKEIARLEFVGPETESIWFVFGVTLSDAPAYLPENDLSYGIPDNWGAGAIMYALIEGLAGIQDGGTSFDRAVLSPRWPAAGVEEVHATGHYPASGGYVDYQYAFASGGDRLQVEFTSSAAVTELRLLVPAERSADRLLIDDEPVEHRVEIIGDSRYVCHEVNGVGVYRVTLELSRMIS